MYSSCETGNKCLIVGFRMQWDTKTFKKYIFRCSFSTSTYSTPVLTILNQLLTRRTYISHCLFNQSLRIAGYKYFKMCFVGELAVRSVMSNNEFLETSILKQPSITVKGKGFGFSVAWAESRSFSNNNQIRPIRDKKSRRTFCRC